MITFTQVVPYVDQAQSEEAISAVTNSFIQLDTTIKNLISESGTPGGFRSVLFNKPTGKLDYDSDRHHISLRLIDQDGTNVYSIIEEQEIGILDWVYKSPRSVIPRGSSKYLIGPDPYKTREPVFLTGSFSSTEYQDLTNLTLSHQEDKNHHITLNYRISIYLTITTQPIPEIKFQVYLILISADFDDATRSIHNNYKQMTIHSTQNFSAPVTLSKNASISTLELVWDSIQIAETTTSSLWSTRSVGLSAIDDFNVTVQSFVYDMNIMTS